MIWETQGNGKKLCSVLLCAVLTKSIIVDEGLGEMKIVIPLFSDSSGGAFNFKKSPGYTVHGDTDLKIPDLLSDESETAVSGLHETLFCVFF